ncbi:hypothetical protein GCK72_008786 [Caenorhabditis remanei]|uniref:Uncharacterized protein n=1 Tax=Caenorhabditis remanei TaxID=31234 RepID=A0A6A5GZN0_CAERE|nr:hypothetical protein GCK72_008786 [Caenorhabditis remanei]KAF1760537.1 hypothetical protein GCK72_008786 [Caenorhabditis remanei]
MSSIESNRHSILRLPINIQHMTSESMSDLNNSQIIQAPESRLHRRPNTGSSEDQTRRHPSFQTLFIHIIDQFLNFATCRFILIPVQPVGDLFVKSWTRDRHF